ncbi:HNH endonuclease [Metabacillus sp. Hm71]|uniref:HNH endonuclease n=1 Tax=Metabacillus sp. Hm71 TaxID=3450743 RepID=UPI003F43988E
MTKEELKQCTKCKAIKPLAEFYKQKKQNKKLGVYYTPSTECKDCLKGRAKIWQSNNRDKMREAYKKCDSQDYRKKIKSDYSKKQKENGYYKNYQQNNKDKFNSYGKNRRMNKEHDISDQEWFECLDYFKISCAYCGITEGEAFELYNQLLHKEHVVHNGVNDVTNCVPACKSCNSNKWEFDLNEWYNENNPIYSKRRYNKIIKWLLSFSEEKAN